MVVHVCNPSTWKVEEVGGLGVRGQAEINETLRQNLENKKKEDSGMSIDLGVEESLLLWLFFFILPSWELCGSHALDFCPLVYTLSLCSVVN